jgi:6-phosphogluconolactonase
MQLFVGTYTEDIKFGTGQILHGKGRGIYVLDFDPQTLTFSAPILAAKTRNPSYLCFSQNKEVLYSTNELKFTTGDEGSEASSFRLTSVPPFLEYQNSESTQGEDACFVVEINNSLIVPNFMSGNIALFPVDDDGGILPIRQNIQHVGSGLHPLRQRSAHVHSVISDPLLPLILIPDLGLDLLAAYDFTDPFECLVRNQQYDLHLVPGDGPRYAVFTKDGLAIYVINELSNTISVFTRKTKSHTFSLQQRIGTRDQVEGESSAADIRLLPSERFLYASNRGADTIACFEVDAMTKELSLVQEIGSGGRIPRSFTVSNNGSFLIVCNQDSDNAVSFKVDQATGFISKQDTVPVPTPVCVLLRE